VASAARHRFGLPALFFFHELIQSAVAASLCRRTPKRVLALAATPKASNNSAQGNTLGKKPDYRPYPERVEYAIAILDCLTLSGLMTV
jgi:hypothetical protein